MAKLCTNCGKALPEDAARFCSSCGAAVLPDSSNAQSLRRSGSQPGSSRPGLHEQIAQQPSPPPLRSGHGEEPPAWLSKLDREVPNGSAHVAEGAIRSEQRNQQQASRTEREFDELPTLPFMSSVPQTPQPRESIQLQFPAHEQVEMLDTRPVLAQERAVIAPVVSQRVSPSPSRPGRQFPRDRSSVPQAIARRSTPIQVRRRQGGLLVVVLIVCSLLLVGGIAASNILFHPFSVPAVTQPRQSFNDRHVGVSLLYPTGWKSSVDQRTLTARLSDSSDTAQVTIAVTGAANKEPVQYLKQQAAQLGMTAVRAGAPVAFAGSTWQQIQGGVQQKGASYTETMLGTIHGDHLFTIIQAAPENVYQDEEHVVFAPMRSSFSFLI